MPKLTKTMSKHLLTIAWDRSMESAHRLMEERKVRHLAVTDEFGKIFGILSSHDVARAMHPSRAFFPDGAAVCSYASSPVKSVTRTASLADVADLLVREKISCALVTGSKGQFCGIVTSEDLLRALSLSIRDADAGSPARRLWPLVGEFLKELQAAGI